MFDKNNAARGTPLWVAGDLNGFFGLFSNSLANFLTAIALLAVAISMPADIVYGKIVPDTVCTVFLFRHGSLLLPSGFRGYLPVSGKCRFRLHAWQASCLFQKSAAQAVRFHPSALLQAAQQQPPSPLCRRRRTAFFARSSVSALCGTNKILCRSHPGCPARRSLNGRLQTQARQPLTS